MPRVRRGTKRADKRRKILKQAKGYFGTRSRAHRIAKQAVDRALAFSYRDRRQRKRQFRRLWIARINAAASSRTNARDLAEWRRVAPTGNTRNELMRREMPTATRDRGKA